MPPGRAHTDALDACDVVPPIPRRRNGANDHGDVSDDLPVRFVPAKNGKNRRRIVPESVSAKNIRPFRETAAQQIPEHGIQSGVDFPLFDNLDGR